MSFQAAEAERRAASMVRVARVVSVDPAKARARVTFGGETESADIPFMAMRAGAAKVWAPPAVGEQVWVLSDSLALNVGGVTLTVSNGGVAIDGGSVTHNGRNIGDDHKHSGVLSGPADTGEPV